MGLNMYLSKKTYIGANYKYRDVKGKVKITINNIPVNIKFDRISYIEEEVGYWRKANHIHNWFVTHCQDGIDDRREVEVSLEQLLQLLSDCKAVKENPAIAKDVLPTKSGYFFGGTDYDEYYFQDIDDTIKIIEDLLSEGTDEDYLGFDVYYSSSW